MEITYSDQCAMIELFCFYPCAMIWDTFVFWSVRHDLRFFVLISAPWFELVFILFSAPWFEIFLFWSVCHDLINCIFYFWSSDLGPAPSDELKKNSFSPSFFASIVVGASHLTVYRQGLRGMIHRINSVIVGCVGVFFSVFSPLTGCDFFF